MFQFIRELNMIYASQNKDSDSQCRHRNVDDMPVYKSFEFIDNSQELKLQEAGFPVSLPGESEEYKGRKKIYVKRGEEDYDMPEMVAFVEDSNYHLFKDKFMDDESVCQDDSLIEDYKLDHHNISSILANDDAESTDSSQEILERSSCITNELQIVVQDDCKEQRKTKMFLMENDEDFEDEIEEILKKRLMMEERKNFDGRDTVWIGNPEEKILHSSYKRLTTEDGKEFHCDYEMRKIHQIEEIRSKKSASSNSLLSTTEAVLYNRSATEACQASLSVPAAIEYCGQVPQTEKPESRMSPKSLKTLSHSLKNQEQNEDSSSDPPSGPIEHSGSIPNSGSICSICSTTSAYSFAFPILASEWPGSPVKIPNADNKPRLPTLGTSRKELRRPHRWRFLVCCKSNKEE